MNSFGRIFRISIFGESHGESIGVLVDGVPSGIKLSEDDFNFDLERRKAGKKGTTPRTEADLIHLESGVFQGFTTGAPIMCRFLNTNTRSKDYKNLVETPRPGHSDFTAKVKYDGFNDYRGGGAFSGRLTLALVAAGVIAKKIINYNFETKIINLGGETDPFKFDLKLDEVIKEGDSIGGIVSINVSDIDKGLGEPYFDSCESLISHLLYSVGGVKGVSFGKGFSGVNLKGSEFNDCFINSSGLTKTNNNGGINGGITNGNDLIVNVFVKPTPSIFKEQETFNFKENKLEKLKIEGRHDAAIILRAQVVLEACVAIALCDLYLVNKALKNN